MGNIHYLNFLDLNHEMPFKKRRRWKMDKDWSQFRSPSVFGSGELKCISFL